MKIQNQNIINNFQINNEQHSMPRFARHLLFKYKSSLLLIISLLIVNYLGCLSFALIKAPAKEPIGPIIMEEKYLPPKIIAPEVKMAAPIPPTAEEKTSSFAPKKENNLLVGLLNFGAILILIAAGTYLIYAFWKGKKE